MALLQAGSAFPSDDTEGSPTDLSGSTTAASLAQRRGPRGYAVAGVDVRSSGGWGAVMAGVVTGVADLEAAELATPSSRAPSARWSTSPGGPTSSRWTPSASRTGRNVPHQQSQDPFSAYERAGATAVLTLVTGAGHTDSFLADGAPEQEVRRTAAGTTSTGTTSTGTTSTGTDPDPTHEAVLAFLEEHLR